MKQYDVLIIGSGIAGLSIALKIAEARPDCSVGVLTKTDEQESNTRYAQGGIAAVWDIERDTFDKHISDTHIAGDDLCNPQVVEIVVKEGPQRVRELIEWGTRFDKDRDLEYDLGKEGGHSENRILHYKDVTGQEIQRALLAKAAQTPNVTLFDHYYAIDIITQHHLGHWITRLTPNITCYGAYALNLETQQIETLLARKTIIATGGAGQVYKTTTNPLIATGDGIAMVYRAKGRVENMEFIQFHPTSLYHPGGENPAFLITEAIRGFGAILRTQDGQELMTRYDERGSLAPRDIVARAIDNEMKIRGEDFVLLDCRHLDQAGFHSHFPNIYDKCRSIGIDPFEQMIPVVPAAHYLCGGIKTDEWGQTSIQNLYACGECTCTGLHGANRLASNSLLEAVVFAHRIHLKVTAEIDLTEFQTNIPEWNAEGTSDPAELVLMTQTLKELREIMSSYVGIVRSNVRLKRASDRLFILYQETEELYNTTTISPQLCEVRNLITIAYLITRSAAIRRESRGLHYTTDYPQRFDYIHNTML